MNGGMGRGLALGVELTSFILLSYWFHKPIAAFFKFDEGHCLAGLMAVSLIMWTVHAYFFFENKNQ